MPQVITVLCGGQSPEHEVSLMSAQNITTGLSLAGYDVNVIYITKSGRWLYLLKEQPLAQLVSLPEDANCFEPVAPHMGHSTFPWVSVRDAQKQYPCDCAFPVFHGPMGEDGTIQGVFSVLGIPYVAPDVLGSALSMHKAVARDVLEQHGIACTPYKWIDLGCFTKQEVLETFHEWGQDVFVKPARFGSALGVSHVKTEDLLFDAIEEAFRFDSHVMIEPAMYGREIEVAVLGKRGAYQAAGPAEIIPAGDDFYSYEEKYAETSSTRLAPKADLSEEVAAAIREKAMQIAGHLLCEGMVRVDGFLTESGDYFFSEANPIPGFTAISQYPQMWEHDGKALPELLKDLIGLAVERKELMATLYETSMKAV